MKRDTKNQHWFLISIVIVLFLFAFVANFLISANLNQAATIPGQEEVYVSTIFGCMPLKDKYTPAQWEAKQNLNKAVFGYYLVRCD